MSKRLIDNINSQYMAAANQLRPKRAQRKIIAYVESYDDIFFWRTLLSEFESDKYRFEVMLPSHDTLAKGKKSALMNTLGDALGKSMIACVDSDYDYLLQDTTHTSRRINRSRYVFQTYTYAIENYQCYAESLHQVCVMATLNDREVVDLAAFMRLYSQIAYPLFIWSVWFYRKHRSSQFSLLDYCNVVKLEKFNIAHPEESLEKMRHHVDRKVKSLRAQYPNAGREIDQLRAELTRLGVTPDTTYLFIQGHHILNNVVMKILGPICARLRREREEEITHLAEHDQQLQNELTAYQHSQASPEFMLKKNTAYKEAPLYQLMRRDVQAFLDSLDGEKDNAPSPKENVNSRRAAPSPPPQ